jgi:hypothetical protein
MPLNASPTAYSDTAVWFYVIYTIRWTIPNNPAVCGGKENGKTF